VEVVEAAPKAQEDAALLAKCQNMFLTTINALAAGILSRFVCAARARAAKRIGEMLPPDAQLRMSTPPRAVVLRQHHGRVVKRWLRHGGGFGRNFGEQQREKVQQPAAAGGQGLGFRVLGFRV